MTAPVGPLSPDGAFDNFDPADYLAEYYSSIGAENDALLRFLAKAYAAMPPGGTLLEVGGGPTVYQLVSAARRAGSITFADPVEANRRVVREWVEARSGAFDWSPFVRRTLEHEGVQSPSEAQVLGRQARLRAVLTRFRTCDVLQPLIGVDDALFDAVGSHFVTESITDDRATWLRGLANLVSALCPGGLFVLSALEQASAWRAGAQSFPAVWLTAADIAGALDGLGVVVDHLERIDAERTDGCSDAHQGYGGMVFVVGHRSRATIN